MNSVKGTNLQKISNKSIINSSFDSTRTISSNKLNSVLSDKQDYLSEVKNRGRKSSLIPISVEELKLSSRIVEAKRSGKKKFWRNYIL